jgi:hypothetical protein
LNANGANRDVFLKVNGTTLMTVQGSTSNVGIGTNAPTAKLTVVSGTPANNEGEIRLSENATYYAGLQRVNATDEFRIGSYGPSQNLTFYTVSSERLRLNASGNLGLGVTPSAWDSGYKALQIGQASSFWGATGSNFTTITNNAIFDGAYKYKNDGIATQYSMGTGGNHSWNIAASGTAGDPITFTQAMTLDASGNLGVGATPSAFYRMTLKGTSSGVNTAIFALTAAGAAAWEIGEASNNTTDFHVYNYQNGYMAFSTNATERARIVSGGAMGVNITNPNAYAQLTVKWDATATSTNNGVGLGVQVSANTTNAIFAQWYNETGSGGAWTTANSSRCW